MAPPNRPPPRELTVLGTQSLTPNMLRLTLGGPGMADFPAGQAGGYVKLRLPSPADPARIVVRTYTIRQQRAVDGGTEIDVDFALHSDSHGEAGPATSWAQAARAGDIIEAGGPGPAKPLPDDAASYLVVGDMTALPAIGVNLAQLPRHARGIAVIEIASDADRQDLGQPEGVAVQWIVNPAIGHGPQQLAAHVRALGWTGGEGAYAWVACEFSAMQAIRQHLREGIGLPPAQLYISSYWKAGLTEDAHKQAKRDDAMALGDG